MPRTPDEKNSSAAPTGARASKKPGAFSKLFAEVAKVASREVGRAWVFALALGTVVVWAVSGPVFGFSDTWQLVINTGTTIVTFLMVFLIQNSQNRHSAAIQVKLDELIRVSKANILGIAYTQKFIRFKSKSWRGNLRCCVFRLKIFGTFRSVLG